MTERRHIGRIEPPISRLGFGAWSIGGAGWEYTGSAERDAESISAMFNAFELGVGWVDTAPIYGNGHSEELVGRALESARGKRPLVFTKCGRLWEGPGSGPLSPEPPAPGPL